MILHERYAVKTIINELDVSNSLVNIAFSSGEDAWNNIVLIESQVLRLASMDDTVGKSM